MEFIYKSDITTGALIKCNNKYVSLIRNDLYFIERQRRLKNDKP